MPALFELPDDIQTVLEEDRTPRVRTYDLTALQRSLNQNNEKLGAMSSLVKWTQSAHETIQLLQTDMHLVKEACYGPQEAEPEPEVNEPGSPVSSRPPASRPITAPNVSVSALAAQVATLKSFLEGELGYDEDAAKADQVGKGEMDNLATVTEEVSPGEVPELLDTLSLQLENMPEGAEREEKTRARTARKEEKAAKREELISQMTELQGDISRAITPFAPGPKPADTGGTGF